MEESKSQPKSWSVHDIAESKLRSHHHPTPSCILETDGQAHLQQNATALVLGTLPAVPTVFPAWTCQAAGAMTGKALVILLFLFIHPRTIQQDTVL